MRKVWRIFVVAVTVAAGLAMPAVSAHAAVLGSAYVWADQPTASSYTPNLHYQWNSTGAANTISRVSTGRYTVYLPNLGGLNGTVLVSAYGGTSNYCKVAGWGPPIMGVATTQAVDVRCFTFSGAPADTQYTMSFTSKLGSHHAWVWADQPSRTDEYTPDFRWQANSTGLPIRVSRFQTGAYTVTIPVDAYGVGHAQVTTYGAGPGICWNTGVGTPAQNTVTVSVWCVSAALQYYDSAFTVTWVREGNLIGQPTLASMYTAEYSGTATHSHMSGDFYHAYYVDGGGTITVTRLGTGQYAVHSTIDAYLTKGNVVITHTADGPRYCSIVAWNPVDGILVNCYLFTGNLHDTGFYLSFTGPRT